MRTDADLVKDDNLDGSPLRSQPFLEVLKINHPEHRVKAQLGHRLIVCRTVLQSDLAKPSWIAECELQASLKLQNELRRGGCP